MVLGIDTALIVPIVYGGLRDSGIPIIIGGFKVNTGAGDLKHMFLKECVINGCI